MTRYRAAAPFMALVLLLPGCSGRDIDGAATVSDSAGVTIVDLGRLDYSSVPQWRLDGESDLRIGVVDGAPEYQWDNIYAADRMSDGTVVVLDRGPREVRAFDADGEHLWTFGREGRGPGEFMYPWTLWVGAGDSTLVSDPGTARVTVVDPGGRLARETRLDRVDGAVVGHAIRGEMAVLLEQRIPEMTELLGLQAIIWRSTLIALDVTTATESPYGTHVLGREYQAIPGGQGSFGPAHFGAFTVFGAGPEGLWVGSPDSYEVALLSTGGLVQRLVRWDGPDRSIRSSDLDRLREVEISREDDPARLPLVEQFLRDQPVADRMATFDKLLLDHEGRIWIRDYRRPDQPEAEVAWLILANDGESVVGRVLHEPALDILAAGADWVAGTWTDDYDVQYLDVRSIRRP